MDSSVRTSGRTALVAVRAMALLTLVLGVGYTFLITGIGGLVFPAQAAGSLVRDADGTVVGSSLIGQSFLGPDGEPLPGFFQPRPSAAGDGYDGGSSSGSNLGPENPELIDAITERRAQIAAFNGVAPSDIPVDALTASSSGLDPHITPEYAALQVQRVASARGIPVATVAELVAEHTRGRDLGYLGEPRVNVLELNLAVDELEG